MWGNDAPCPLPSHLEHPWSSVEASAKDGKSKTIFQSHVSQRKQMNTLRAQCGQAAASCSHCHHLLLYRARRRCCHACSWPLSTLKSPEYWKAEFSSWLSMSICAGKLVLVLVSSNMLSGATCRGKHNRLHIDLQSSTCPCFLFISQVAVTESHYVCMYAEPKQVTPYTTTNYTDLTIVF